MTWLRGGDPLAVLVAAGAVVVAGDRTLAQVEAGDLTDGPRPRRSLRRRPLPVDALLLVRPRPRETVLLEPVGHDGVWAAAALCAGSTSYASVALGPDGTSDVVVARDGAVVRSFDADPVLAEDPAARPQPVGEPLPEERDLFDGSPGSDVDGLVLLERVARSEVDRLLRPGTRGTVVVLDEAAEARLLGEEEPDPPAEPGPPARPPRRRWGGRRWWGGSR